MKRAVFESSYRRSFDDGSLRDKIRRARLLMDGCRVCPRSCGVARNRSERGFCRSGPRPVVSSSAPHFGEEKPLVGRHGSGTIFFTHCNLGCLFCQNYSISHGGDGREVSPERLSRMMVELQGFGCHNVNFVSPSHFVPQILEALPRAIELGLEVPLVYNTGGYDSVETLGLLDGVVDIYMPDFKFIDSGVAALLTGAPDYPDVAARAIKEMHRQVGDLVVDDRGIARRGLLVRHLVLPGGLAGTAEVMRFLSSEISPDTYVNVMAQYHPCGSIPPGSPLVRRITAAEYERAVSAAREAGLRRLD